jgi:hypothetical protein
LLFLSFVLGARTFYFSCKNFFEQQELFFVVVSFSLSFSAATQKPCTQDFGTK